mgnify:CR=1 FL=1
MFKWISKLFGYNYEPPIVGEYYQLRANIDDPFNMELIVCVQAIQDEYVLYNYYQKSLKIKGVDNSSASIVSFNLVYGKTDKTVELKK